MGKSVNSFLSLSLTGIRYNRCTWIKDIRKVIYICECPEIVLSVPQFDFEMMGLTIYGMDH